MTPRVQARQQRLPARRVMPDAVNQTKGRHSSSGAIANGHLSSGPDCGRHRDHRPLGSERIRHRLRPYPRPRLAPRFRFAVSERLSGAPNAHSRRVTGVAAEVEPPLATRESRSGLHDFVDLRAKPCPRPSGPTRWTPDEYGLVLRSLPSLGRDSARAIAARRRLWSLTALLSRRRGAPS